MKNQEELKEDFFAAVMNGNIEEVKNLINQGVDINSTTLKGNNAIYLAAIRKRRDVFDYLLPKVNLDSQNSFGSTTLYELINEDSMEYYVEKIIKSGANPNIESGNGLTPLIQACAFKKKSYIDLLLSEPSIDINKEVKKSKSTAFLMACSQSDLNVVKKLVDAGANYNALDREGKNGLLNLFSINDRFQTKGEKQKHTELKEYLLGLNIDLDYVAPSGMTAFYMASAQADVKSAKIMLDKGVNINVSHELGLEGSNTAMHMWCQMNNKKLPYYNLIPTFIEELLNNGAKLGVKDSSGNLPESFGLLDTRTAQIMLDNGANVNAVLNVKIKNERIELPVFAALLKNPKKNMETIKQMIQMGVDVTYTNPKYKKEEPIYTAITIGSVDLLNLLLDTNKIDLNQHIKLNPKVESISPLSFLLSSYTNSAFKEKTKEKEFYKTIITAKEENDKNGIISEHVNNENIDEFKKIVENIDKLEKSVSESIKFMFDALIKNNVKLNVPNENGNTEVFFAKNAEYTNWLIEKGADIYHKNNLDQDLLYYSIINNKKDTLELLKNEYTKSNHSTINNWLYQISFEDFSKSSIKQKNVESGIINYLNNDNVNKIFDHNVKVEDKPTVSIKEVNYIDEDGNSPIIVASANDSPFLVSTYIKLGADINHTNKLGETALMHAVTTENNLLTELLITKGADKDIVNNEGKTALDIAYELGNEKVIKSLIQEQEKKLKM